MGRIRTVKPELARHRGLFEAEGETGLPLRFAWALLPTACDRQGRFRWRPWDLKLDVLPYDDLDFSALLDALWTRGYLVRYECLGEEYGWIPTFLKHQVPNNKERASVLPAPDGADSRIIPPNEQLTDATGTRELRDGHATTTPLVLSRGELELELEVEVEGKKPSVADATGDDGQPDVDPRHAPIRSLIQSLHLEKFRVTCQWDGSEGKALARLLAANPSWDEQQLTRMVRNRFGSDEVPSDRPRKWLPDLGTYAAGPLTRFKNLKGGTNGDRTNGNRAEQRKRDNLAAREEARAAVVGN
ncbi:MAG: hypothetical protein ACHP7P_11995 [Terriglobales bacterium]